MVEATTSRGENPFPAQAVTTFGAQIRDGATFEFMRTVRDHVNRYLIDYAPVITAPADSVASSGGALGLNGEHGSGKTFLLCWLRGETERITRRPCRVAYAKADGPLFVSLYHQILSTFTQAALQEVVRKALTAIGEQITGAARATEASSKRIREGVALEAIMEQKELDLNEVYLSLKSRIATSGAAPAVAAKVAEAIGLLEDPALGKAAFEWLKGAAPDSLEARLPFAGPLWQTGPENLLNTADAAVNALECMAALFRLAGVPLILLIDQLENFASPAENGASWSSILKKLVEQTGRQSAFVVLAGTRLAWDRLPRDVGPRLLRREALPVGNLNIAETTLLLSVYAGPDLAFRKAAVETIHGVSGGSPREVLQIAHRCFEKSRGMLGQVDDAIVFEAARDGGTLKDREMLALMVVDRELAQLGLPAHELRLPAGEVVARFVENVQGRSIAIVLAVAKDALDEVAAANRLSVIRGKLESIPGQIELLVVAVGYTSQRVQTLVNAISHVLPFDGGEFEAKLHAALTEWVLTARQAPPPVGMSGPGLDAVLKQIGALQKNLEKLQSTRRDEGQDRLEQLSKGAEELARSEQAIREARTKWELLDGLDALRDSLDARKTMPERKILRSLLVANEANVKDRAFDFLGGQYMDVLDAEMDARDALTSEVVIRQGEEEKMWQVIADARVLRSELIGHARDTLMRSQKSLIFDRGVIITAAAALMTVTYVGVMLYYVRELTVELKLLMLLAVAVLAGLLGFYYTSIGREPERRYSSIVSRAKGLRNMFRPLE